MPKSIEAPQRVVVDIKRVLDRRSASLSTPGEQIPTWNEKLRDQKYGVTLPFPGAYQGRASVQVGFALGLYEQSGDVEVPLVAYVVAWGASYNIPIANVSLYLTWEPSGRGGYLEAATVSATAPDHSEEMQRLRDHFG